MKRYLSYGGGVNSTALLILLKEEGIEFETVFVDHGGDFPYTYDYVGYLKNEGCEITILKPNVEGCSTLYDYSMKYGIIPLRQMRWCTDKFKIRVMEKYFERPCTNYLGISKDEERRSFNHRQKDIINKFPLIERQINRIGCIELIKKAGLRVPKRSGCYFCPFQPKKQIKDTYLNYPELYEKMKRMEHNSKTVIKDKPIEIIVGEMNTKIDNYGGM